MKHTAVFQTTTDTESIIPSKAMSHLPLSRQALSAWNESSDIYQYLFDLYSGTGYGSVAANYYSEALQEFQGTAATFRAVATNAIPAPGSATQDVIVPNFLECPLFGLVAKCMTAWDNLVGNMMAESSFFSLPHLLETRSDLRSSIFLAAHLYYRQALQAIRCYIESVVLPIYFCMDPNMYSKWKKNAFHTPPLRGKKGILAELSRNGVLPNNLADQVSTTYGDLNAYIHGSEQSLNNSGLPSGTWEGHIFRMNKYDKWATTFSGSIFLGIALTRIHHEQWQRRLANHGTVCRICHGTSFSVKETGVADARLEYTCSECGNSFHLNAENKQVVVTTVNVSN